MSIEVSGTADEPDGFIGQVVASRYRIEARLGEGAMGAVYKARHVKVGRPFAVKVLHAHLLEDKKVLQRFEREAELAGRLRHPNVIGVVDVGELPDGTRYMVMDFAAGPDLSTLLSEAPMPPKRIIHLVRQMLEGLFHAHEAGLIHRDFKPENVIVEHDTHGAEVPRIVDFGIAILREGGDSSDGPGRLTTNGLVLGTPHYMAPEQAVADPIDHRIDLFALGIMIYEMLCGKLPFDGSGAEVARANLMLDPPPIAQRVPYLEVDPLLEAFARRLMAKKRDARPANAKIARDLLDLIERDRAAAAAALGVPVEAARPERETQPVQPQRSGSPNDTYPPPLARGLEAPPMAAAAVPAPVAVAQRMPRGERDIQTDPVRARRARWPVAALAFAVLAGGGVVAYELHGGEPAPVAAPAPAAPTAPTVATAEPPLPAPASHATPAQPPPATAPTQPTAAGSDATATGSDAAAAEPATPTAPATHVTHATRHSHTGASTHAGAQHVAASHADAQPEVKQPVVVQPEVKQPEVKPAAPAPLSARALAAQYQAVGAALKQLAVAKGSAAAADLASRYSLIRIGDALTTQPKRDAAAAVLSQLQREISTRSR